MYSLKQDRRRKYPWKSSKGKEHLEKLTVYANPSTHLCLESFLMYVKEIRILSPKHKTSFFPFNGIDINYKKSVTVVLRGFTYSGYNITCYSGFYLLTTDLMILRGCLSKYNEFKQQKNDYSNSLFNWKIMRNQSVKILQRSDHQTMQSMYLRLSSASTNYFSEYLMFQQNHA